VVVAAVIAGGVYLVRYRPQGEATSPPAVEHKPVPSTPEGMPSRASTEQPTAEKPSPAPAPETSADETVARYVPAIPKSARETIQGRVKVRVRVNVDASGNVVGSKVDLHGPSDYFARQAQQAAMRWKFSPSPEEKRQWVLQFEFARGGTQVFPSRVKGNH
jgi:TonB family protein